MRPGTVARIARWEVAKGTETVSRRTVLGVVVALAVSAALGSALAGATVTPDAGLYRIGVAPDSPYHGPAAQDPTFAVREPSREALRTGRLELLVIDGELLVADDRKGRAALAEFRAAVERYNDRRMLEEDDASAAFPVSVRLEYADRTAETGATAGAGGDGGSGTVADGGGRTGDDGTGGDAGGETGDDGGSRTGVDGEGGDESSATGGTGVGDASDGGDGLAVPRLGGQPLLASSQEGTPSGIQPPFPLGALVLAFLFVVPMNFVVQAYGASMLRERINRRGELLLVAPVSPAEIVAGKTLPYFLGILGVSVVTAVGVGGGPMAVAAAAPVALLFLAATFVAAMFARSFKELTFLTVTVSVVLTSYAFVPAIFTEVTPVALISPLTLVVRDLLAVPTTAGEYAFSTGPFYLSSLVLFLLGAGVYREEDLFTQRPVHLKALDALASRVGTGTRGPASVFLLTVAFIPFVLVGELLAVALLFALPVALSLPVLLVAVAAIEELAKSAHVLAAYHHDRFDPGIGGAVGVGAASGVGFFLGEKVVVLAQVVGLPELLLGRAAFPDAAALGAGALLVLLGAPLVLHVWTAAVSAIGASRNARTYLAGYGTAVVVHVVYNAAVVSYVT